jgi:hypothetical protein
MSRAQVHTIGLTILLGMIEKLRNATISSWCLSIWLCVPVCLFARMEQIGSNWTDFHEICFVRICQKSVQKIQVPLKSEENNGYFSWKPLYINDNITLSSS